MSANIIELSQLQVRINLITIQQLQEAINLIENCNVLGFVNHCYKNLFIINFDWSNWKEGKEFIKKYPREFQNKDAVFCYKLLTAIVRSDRFNEGVIKANIMDATLRGLFERLITIYSS